MGIYQLILATSPRSIGIIGLGAFSSQVFGFKGLIGKVLTTLEFRAIYIPGADLWCALKTKDLQLNKSLKVLTTLELEPVGDAAQRL
jgi:hypothetical protein